MLKETGYQEKFEMLHVWMNEIIETVKKDLKNEHLKMDREFCRRYFLGKNPSHIQMDEMVDAYAKDIANGNVGLGEFIATRWLLKNTDIYGYFEEKLKEITPDFDELDVLDEELSHALMHSAVNHYGAPKTYLFTVFNSVVFPESVYRELRELAEKESDEIHKIVESQHKAESIEALQVRHAREISAMKDRYEKKLSGMQKKYLTDVAVLKKQISQLQKKLAHISHQHSSQFGQIVLSDAEENSKGKVESTLSRDSLKVDGENGG